MNMRMRAWCVIFMAVALGCDREPPAPPPPTAQKPSGMVVEVQGVTPLLPDRRTHVAPTGTGKIFWVQESPDVGGRETVFALAEGGLPGATPFSNAAVLDALGERGGTGGARGSLQSLAVGPEGDVFFFFAGETRRKLLMTLGAFSPSTGQTRVLADSTALRDASGMGNTLALARGCVLRGPGSRTWLWLRHDHGFALLAVEPGTSGSTLRRLFDRVRAPDDEPLALVSPRDDLQPSSADGWTYLDRARGRLWRIGPTGGATPLADVSDLPKALSAPSPDDRGRPVMFAPDGPPFVEPPDEPASPAAPPAVDLPAWVTLDGDRRTVLARPKFRLPARLNVRSLAFPEIVRDRASWLGYDTQTGELLRIRVVPR